LTLEIVNIIATARIKGKINVEKIHALLTGSEYNPEIFCGLILKKNSDKPTRILFASGKISSHGAKSEKLALDAIEVTLKEITKMGAVSGISEFEWMRIENVVGCANLNKFMDLEELYSALPSGLYEPEQFPGLIYKPFKDSITCLVFASGKMVIAGGKSENQIKQAFDFMQKKLKETNYGHYIKSG
jgi:transcription initiation factor TFIID TATA-box-binding protein